jgi:UDP-N-acetylglucosamine diphosphorylase / glucose-1-phosphate thymidylyltransferase / UDP-N-acetylgalactosamine diphosphorylase / glucosamine-1-phosphate N-acetyltransferase / galactosamine-1-phosphate N-acetyltransferase
MKSSTFLHPTVAVTFTSQDQFSRCMILCSVKESNVPFSPDQFFTLSEFTHQAIFAHCNTVWEALRHLKQYLREQALGKIEVSIPEGVTLVHPELISIGIGTKIEPGSYIKGPCIIGKNCEIRHAAYIRGDVLMGDNSIIGHTTEVKHSILLNKAYAAHFAYVGDSILGNNTNLGAGVKIANLRLDGNDVVIQYQGEMFSTGLRKLGAIIGDSVQIGCNTVINPGTIVGKDVFIYPTIAVRGVIPQKSIVREDKKLYITAKK